MGAPSTKRRIARVLSALERRLPLLWALFAGLLLFGLSGLPRITFDDALLRFFESDFQSYRDYADVARDFESDGDDVVLLIEAEDLADPAALAAVSALLLEAQFVEGVRAAISPLSLDIATPDGRTEPLVPFPLPAAEVMADRYDRVRAETPVLRRLLSDDRSAMLAILPLASDETLQPEAIAGLRALADRASAEPGLAVRLAGYPVLRENLAQGLIGDVILLNLLGAAVGFVVASVALRSLALGALTLPGPLVAVILALGAFGHLGVAITTVTVTLPVLVMILATIDSLHILFERAKQGRRENRRATLRAVRRVGIACLFAAVTTAIAFAALSVSRAGLIAELGRMGAGLLLLSVVAVMLTQVLVLTAAGRSAHIAARLAVLAQRPPRWGGVARVSALALARPRAVTLLALAAFLAATVLYGQAGPRYAMLDSLRADDPLRATFTDIEAKVAPMSAVQVAVRGADVEALAKIERTIADATGSTLVQSVASIPTGGSASLPEPIARRLVTPDGARALVTVPFPYESGAQTLDLARRIDAALAANPDLAGLEIGPATGLPVMSAAVVGAVLSDLNRGLLIAIGVIWAIIALWLRSPRIALLALLPNLLPVALIGAGLALAGQGIKLANGLALTIAFGVAVDDTLHVLNRIRLAGGFTQGGLDRLSRAMKDAAPVLATTSIVLVLGFGGSAFAATREVADFGLIATAVFVLALLADLIVLPAAVAFLSGRFYLPGRKGP